VSKDDQYFKEKEESMYLDASWNLIDAARFREAKNRLENREFDIREMLVLFKEYIPLTFTDKFTFNNNKNIAVTLGRVQVTKIYPNMLSFCEIFVIIWKWLKNKLSQLLV
jgi:hypothetical protein